MCRDEVDKVPTRRLGERATLVARGSSLGEFFGCHQGSMPCSRSEDDGALSVTTPDSTHPWLLVVTHFGDVDKPQSKSRRTAKILVLARPAPAMR